MDLNSRLRQSPSRNRREDRGYVLLSLLLMVTLLVVGFAVLLPAFTFEMKRDQEQELIHRGVQYSRGIRAYYKKFGRYPTRLEDLDNTNNLRFLRKHYKDPITGQDFKLLHFGEQGVTVGTGGISFGGGQIPGATPAGAPGGLSSGPGNSGFSNSGFGNSNFGNSSSGVNSNGVFAQSSGLGGNSNSTLGANSNYSANGAAVGGKAADGTDSSQASSQDSSSAKGSANGASDP